jgi:hypothetical protein
MPLEVLGKLKKKINSPHRVSNTCPSDYATGRISSTPLQYSVIPSPNLGKSDQCLRIRLHRKHLHEYTRSVERQAWLYSILSARGSLTFKKWQFLELTVFANVESRGALTLVLLDVWRAWIFDLVDLCWGWDVGSGQELLLWRLLWLLWLLQLQRLLGCLWRLCRIRVRLDLQTEGPPSVYSSKLTAQTTK